MDDRATLARSQPRHRRHPHYGEQALKPFGNYPKGFRVSPAVIGP
jgi:hypothetical protein